MVTVQRRKHDILQRGRFPPPAHAYIRNGSAPPPPHVAVSCDLSADFYVAVALSVGSMEVWLRYTTTGAVLQKVSKVN